MKMEEYLHLYLGCATDLGELIGVNKYSYFIRLKTGDISEREFGEKPLVKLILRKISTLNINESAVLNQKGLSIGRPGGYSFSPDAILYLLSLGIDLFNLINDGLAIEMNQ